MLCCRRTSPRCWHLRRLVDRVTLPSSLDWLFRCWMNCTALFVFCESKPLSHFLSQRIVNAHKMRINAQGMRIVRWACARFALLALVFSQRLMRFIRIRVGFPMALPCYWTGRQSHSPVRGIRISEYPRWMRKVCELFVFSASLRVIRKKCAFKNNSNFKTIEISQKIDTCTAVHVHVTAPTGIVLSKSSHETFNIPVHECPIEAMLGDARELTFFNSKLRTPWIERVTVWDYYRWLLTRREARLNAR